MKKALITLCIIGCSTVFASGLLPTSCVNTASTDEKILTYSNGVKIDTMSFETNPKNTTLDKALDNFISLDLNCKGYKMVASMNFDNKNIEFGEVYENKKLNILGTNCDITACYLSSYKYSVTKKSFMALDKKKCHDSIKSKTSMMQYQTGKGFKVGLIVFMPKGKKIEISAAKGRDFNEPTSETGLYFSANVKVNNIEQILKKPFVLKDSKNKTYKVKTQKQFSDLINKNTKDF